MFASCKIPDDVGATPEESPPNSVTSEDTDDVKVRTPDKLLNKCHCEEISEKESKVQGDIKKLKHKVKQLAEANQSWEKHCETLQERFQDQMSMLMQELTDAKTHIRRMERNRAHHEEQLSQIETEAEKQLHSAEEQTTKAATFASAQAQKVDELKKMLKKQKQHIQNLEQKVQELERQKSVLRQSMGQQPLNPNQGPAAPVDEMLQLNVENTPPQSFGATQQSQASVEGSLWESIPPSLLLEHPMTNECCRQTQQKLAQTSSEIKVLHQQMAIYKEDFLKERSDREKSHSEIASLQSTCMQLSDDIKLLQDNLDKKTRELDATKTARQQEQESTHSNQAELQRVERSLREARSQVAQLQEENARLKRQPPQQQPTPTNQATPQAEVTFESPFQPISWKREIQRHYATFVNYLKTFEVVSIMYSKNLLDFGTKSRIDAMQIESDRTRYLFSNIIMRMTRREVLAFKQILFDTNQASLARLLPSENYTGPDWNCAKCTFKNKGNRDRCEMCNTRAPSLETLPGFAEQYFEQEPEWVQSAGLNMDA